MSTLATLRDRVEATLQDAANARWSTGDLDEAIRRALEAYSRADPRETIGTLTLPAAGREVDISSLSGRLAVTRVWWPYDAASPDYPPNWCAFEEWGDVLFVDDPDEPASGDKVRVWYTTLHTLDGLDGASATTLPPDAGAALVCGAAGLAAEQRAAELAETLNVDAEVVRRLAAFATRQLDRFQAHLDRLSRQMAARASGVAPAPRLDRWDPQADETW